MLLNERICSSQFFPLTLVNCHAELIKMPTFYFQPIRLLNLDRCYNFTLLMANNADSDQLAWALHCLQRQGIYGIA